MEDVTEKTDYDTIGGTDNVLKYVDAKTGEAKSLMPASDLEGAPAALVGRWTMVRVREEGRSLRAGRSTAAKARSLTPKPKPEPEDEKAASATARTTLRRADDKEKEAEESFTAGRRSAATRTKLLVTSRKGWYIVHRRRRGAGSSSCPSTRTRTRTRDCR